MIGSTTRRVIWELVRLSAPWIFGVVAVAAIAVWWVG